jgi:acyl-CoA thioesterase II
MGDLEVDTAVEERGDGRYAAVLSDEWEIWGPMGGYVAACALRAAGAVAGGGGDGGGNGGPRRPVAFSCHYLNGARFGPVDLRVEARKVGRAASSHRVEVTQGGRPILDALVWSAAEAEGLEHDETDAPAVPGPDELPSIVELMPSGTPAPFPFWENFDFKPLDFEPVWPPGGPRPARWQGWLRFLPTATFEDPWVDAARSVILTDLPSWPCAHRPHAWREPPFTAPTLDLNVAFHQPTAGHEWLLCDGAAPLSTGGVFGWSARIWSPGGKLHASGGGQCLYRPLPPTP